MSSRWKSQVRDGWRIAGHWLLALQIVLISAVSVSGAPVQRDIFGNPLCVTESGGDNSTSRHDLPECCMGACAVAYGFSPGATGAKPWSDWQPRLVTLSVSRTFNTTPLPRIDFLGSQPRAPPVMA